MWQGSHVGVLISSMIFPRLYMYIIFSDEFALILEVKHHIFTHLHHQRYNIHVWHIIYVCTQNILEQINVAEKKENAHFVF